LAHAALYDASDDFCIDICSRVSIDMSNNLLKNKIDSQNKKLINLRKLFGVFQFDVQNTVLNLRDETLNEDEMEIITHLNQSISYRFLIQRALNI
jgi:hypothetical protein